MQCCVNGTYKYFDMFEAQSPKIPRSSQSEYHSIILTLLDPWLTMLLFRRTNTSHRQTFYLKYLILGEILASLRLESLFLIISTAFTMSVTVFNNTSGAIQVSVALIEGADDPDGRYFTIAANGTKIWTRTAPGATAFVIKGNPVARHGNEPDVRFIADGQTLVVN